MHDAHPLWLAKPDISPTMKDVFDIRQALVSFRKGNTQLILGRQPLKFGDERLVGISDWTNVSRTFDAIDVRYGSSNRVDIFTSSVVNIYPTSLDRSQGGLHFHGVVGSLNTWIPHTSLEPFLLVKTLNGVRNAEGHLGGEEEFTFGAFAAGDLPRNTFYTGTLAIQRGSYAGDSIQAQAGMIRAGYTAKYLFWAPELSGEYDYAAGDDHRSSGTHKTFDQLYPSNHNAFGLVDLFGWQNIKELRLNLAATPREHVTILFQVGSLHLATSRDNLYSSGGGTLLAAPANAFPDGSVGTEFDTSGKYVLKQNIVFNAGAGHLFPGAVMTRSGLGVPLTIAYFSITYRFKLMAPPGAQSMSEATRKSHRIPSSESDDY